MRRISHRQAKRENAPERLPTGDARGTLPKWRGYLALRQQPPQEVK